MRLAIFDLDNTLLNGDSDHAWGEFLCQQGVVDETEYRQANDYFYQQYQDGSLNIEEFLEFALRPLRDLPKERLNALHKEFMSTKVLPMISKKSRDLLQKHREQGNYLLIITATNAFVTFPIAKELGVDDIMATMPEYINDAYTGKVEGIPCFQDGKVNRLTEWLKLHPEHSLEGSYFYSDSINDLPLLEQVDHPIAVDADEKLTAIASQRGWKKISLR